MKVVAIITSRWHSKRLPGKALMDIAGRPMLQHVVDRVRQAKLVDEVIVATTANSRPIVEYCVLHDILCYAGSEDDVLDRMYQTVKHYQGDVIVYVWGDCPLIKATEIDKAIKAYRRCPVVPYVYNPRGPLAVMPQATLNRLSYLLTSTKDREWFHLYMLNSEGPKLILSGKIPPSVDTAEDLKQRITLLEAENVAIPRREVLCP